ncbi:GDSL-type esterase/lipase family protein [Desulfovibrio inopinatus]|uniref:GDSL-type esterase/lipase family protein n=1 Tax=Desulfovibrio inopinatus TaxID=102109 RepID=UPI0003F742DC|nr:GDSL-type esterase/lipase family protein [Desulfovibrio inopinatus]
MQPNVSMPLAIAFLGDSLTQGWGQLPHEAFPARLQAMLNQAGETVRVSNFGISGDTTADALSRLPLVLASKPDIVVVALGINDAYQGIAVEVATANLVEICTHVVDTHANLILVGAFAPLNHGNMQREAYRTMYSQLAEQFNAVLMPDILESVAGNPDLTHPDGVHPNALGYERIALRFFPLVSDVASKRRKPT